jgi:uncharacterized protein (DUF2237 family)
MSRAGPPDHGPRTQEALVDDQPRPWTGPEARGSHTVCAEVLAYSFRLGNELSTPRPQYGFSGLRSGDRRCVCASRWLQACEAGCAPGVILGSTSEAACRGLPRAHLRTKGLDSN